jgi:hypothetical protein
MNAASPVPAGEPKVIINTRLTDDFPDVLDIHIPVVDRSIALVEKLARREMTPDRYMEAVKDLQEELDLVNSLATYIDRTLDEKRDIVVFQRTRATHREAIQFFYLAPNVFHPPHCHHNILSTQLILRGHAHVREFDRIARLSPDTLLLKMRLDARLGPGEALRATEISRNCHWFASGDEPCVMLNFNAYGYQDWTFNPPGSPLRRNLVDPTFGLSPDGLIIAKEISVEDSYGKFGGRALSDFPMPN